MAVKHVVLFSFKPGTAPAAIEGAFADLAALKGVIPGLMDFAGGPNTSAEGLTQGHTHGFVMTFRDAASRDAYLPHPAHEAVKAKLIPIIETLAVVDFEG